MRIIAGTHRSRIIEEVPLPSTRETKDRIKEAIFNSLQYKLEGASVLDLFAGSGALGLEAISRGAKRCCFVDHQKEAIATIQKNILSLNVQDQTEVRYATYDKTLEKDEKYDIIFLDPPYDLLVIDQIIDTIESNKLLTPYGVIVALYSSKVSLNEKEFGIIEYKQKRYGITNVSYLKWRLDDEEGSVSR